MITLVLGGNKSGKSAFALELLEKAPGPRLIVPTGKAMDLNFRQQILDHKQDRGPGVPVLETGDDLPEALRRIKEAYGSIVVDSLDFWLFSCLRDSSGHERIDELLQILDDWKQTELILVSCEIGLGPLSADRETRYFVRRMGGLNQAVARVATQVYLVSAGLPLALKKA
ncbi:MAG: bifunctional adenosylcobinamide kinase/adenosylcobinamide-phosphate guanylyltransferase [Desulfovibrionaceae bacterium]